VVRLQSEETATDPRPEVPRLFLSRPKVHKLVSQLHRQRTVSSSETTEEESIGELLAEAELAKNKLDPRPDEALDEPSDQVASTSSDASSKKQQRGPVRLQRTCVATLEGADACGRTLVAESARRGLDQAPRKGFVGDGQSSIWSVW
jgi:hypothetical protein